MAVGRLALVSMVILGVAGCGGNDTLSCDEVAVYQLAVPGKRVETPPDLDALEPLREIPLPEASPQQPRPPGSRCIDMPPEVNLGE